MIIWTIILIVSIILLIASITLLIIKKYKKCYYYFDYVEDELIKEEAKTNSYNYLYFTHGEAIKYIPKYVYCVSNYDKFVICSYKQEFKEISFFVLCYDKNNKIISAKNYQEFNTNSSSKIISLNKKTKSINIIIASINKVAINTGVLKPLKISKINKYSALLGVSVASALNIIRHFVGLIICQKKFDYFLSQTTNLVLFIGSLAIGLITCLIFMISIRRKNVKCSKGAAIEYEFI